jgi:hypothetical protein
MIPRRALVQNQKIGDLGIVKCSGNGLFVLSGHRIICCELILFTYKFNSSRRAETRRSLRVQVEVGVSGQCRDLDGLDHHCQLCNAWSTLRCGLPPSLGTSRPVRDRS